MKIDLMTRDPSASTGFVSRLVRKLDGFRARWRTPIVVIALLAFTVGVFLSIRSVELDAADIDYGKLAILVLVLVPVSIAYSAVNMTLMGRAAGTVIGFWPGVRISAYAQMAEILPIPGGAIVRTAALVKSGGKTLLSTGIVIGFSLLWIACAAIGGGYALLAEGPAGAALLGTGTIAASIISMWLWQAFGLRIALEALLLRIFGVFLVAARIFISFAALGLTAQPSEAVGIAFAVILGSAASIVPAGIGIGEGLAALMAAPVGVAPEAAFLAVALNRVAGLVWNIVVAGIWFAKAYPERRGTNDR